VAVKMNNTVGPYFMSYKGGRQGDPMSPLLFNFAADVLTRMVRAAQQNSLVTGLADNLIPNGVALLQYADDTVLCLENNFEKARNVKLLLYMFEKMSGLKINFDKSEVILIGGDNALASQFADLFNCQVGLFPMQYLGVPIVPGRLHVIDWARLEDKYAKKIDVWQWSSLSMAGRTTLINASFVNSTLYHMSMYLVPKTVIKRLDKNRRKIFWQGGSLKRKYHLVRWQKICRLKKKGGLGIKNLWKMNIALLCKWWWALETGNGLWQDIVRIKYVQGSPICLIPNRLNDSPIWSDLLKVRSIYLRGRGVKVNNGRNVSFWLEPWIDDKPLCLTYPVLFELATNQRSTVREVGDNSWVIHFKTRLQGLARDQWYNLAYRLNNVNLNEENDSIFWRWSPSKTFTVKSVYDHLTKDDDGPKFQRVWKAKIPEKIKTFMWLVEQQAILTKDDMLRRRWQGDPACYFCDDDETIDHLFFGCPIAKVIWGVMAICFGQTIRPNSYGQF
jgi:hypothetical protein